eukprot:CAMPEP_0201489276 /NCGR_PEP_ID=MMETSP0151_2-20130828/21730_1 /ASSEMBLY_ACC=CAM_ASM_000257 /TAXON_ID=200890 /ORGANISM="Paramoeba atlantica, Strain 621/1 / CCAP 1560/9" /LENGTH=229 /DNA_ID=CAMNT_0047874811 /DNA_START=76 /DNA_END=765 /DNA_ORIENTATION=-
MDRFFGAKKEVAPPPSLDEAGQRMDSRIQALDQRIQSLDQQLLQCQKQLGQTKSPVIQKGIKEKAFRLLKQKKQLEAQRDQMIGSQINLSQAQFTIDSMRDTAVTVEAMKAANSSIQQQMQSMDVNSVYNLQDQLEEAFDYQNEIQEVMARSYGVPDDIDEADLEAELEALQMESQSTATPSFEALFSSESAPVSEAAATPAEQDEYGLPAVAQASGPQAYSTPTPWGL